MKSQAILSKFILTPFIALLLVLTILPPSVQATHHQGHREDALMEELIYDALFDPSNSQEARWVLAEMLGVPTDGEAYQMDDIDIEAYREEFGKYPTQMPAVMVVVILERREVDGARVLEYHRMWMRLDDDFDNFQSVKIKVQAAASNLLSKEGLTTHHLDKTTIQLVPSNLHNKIPHIGSASDLRRGE